MPLAFSCSIHDLNSLSGTSKGISQVKSSRYRRFGRALLQNAKLYPSNISSFITNSYPPYAGISSLRLFNSSVTDATIVLFKSNIILGYSNDFEGTFLQVTNAKGGDFPIDLNNLGNLGFGNQTTSMLLINVNKGGIETRVSFRDLFLNEWNTTLDQLLNGQPIKRVGEPLLTWEMWPENLEALSPFRMYLKVKQKLQVEIPILNDYDAWITYHIFLFIDGNKRLRGQVHRQWVRVESGPKTGSILEKLVPSVESGTVLLNSRINARLAQDDIKNVKFNSLYYLPGRQLSRPNTGILSGTTYDDVTIVLVS